MPTSVAAALAQADTLLQRLVVLEDGPEVWAEFQRPAVRFDFAGKQVHDANIVATMLAYREHRLVTFNTKDFRRFIPLIEITSP